MKRSEYKKTLKSIGLSKEQIEKLRAVLEDLMTTADRKAYASELGSHFNIYFSGKSDGLNTMDRFLRGDMECHDEFED